MHFIVLFFSPATGEADARLWASIGTCYSLTAHCHELNLVLENFQGTKENASEKALSIIVQELLSEFIEAEGNANSTYMQSIFTCEFSPVKEQ